MLKVLVYIKGANKPILFDAVSYEFVEGALTIIFKDGSRVHYSPSKWTQVSLVAPEAAPEETPNVES